MKQFIIAVIMVVLAAASVQGVFWNATDVSAWYHLENTSWVDSSGNGNTLTAFGTPTINSSWWTIGNMSYQGASASGAQDTSTTSLSSGDADMSVGIWVKRDNPTLADGNTYFISAGQLTDVDNFNHLNIGTATAGGVETVQVQGRGYSVVSGTYVMNKSQDYLFVATYESSTDTITLYDGNAVVLATGVVSLSICNGGSGVNCGIVVGNRWNHAASESPWLNGLDDARVFKFVLNSSQIRHWYNASHGNSNINLDLDLSSPVSVMNVSSVSPADSAIFNYGDPITLSWNASDTLSLTELCTPRYNSTFLSLNTSASGTIVNRLLPVLNAGSWNWRVNCSNANSGNATSAVRSFTINSLATNASLLMNGGILNLSVMNSTNITIQTFINNGPTNGDLYVDGILTRSGANLSFQYNFSKQGTIPVNLVVNSTINFNGINLSRIVTVGPPLGFVNETITTLNCPSHGDTKDVLMFLGIAFFVLAIMVVNEIVFDGKPIVNILAGLAVVMLGFTFAGCSQSVGYLIILMGAMIVLLSGLVAWSRR